MKTKILIVEDEETILTGLIDLFVYHGFEVDTASDGKIGLDKALRYNYHLLLLDVMLPFIDGFAICEAVRKKDRSLPIILLTARGNENDIVHGLKMGADDYISKPFSIQELLARVNAVLRRSPKLISDKQKIAWNDFVIDCENLLLQQNGETTELTQREVDLLRYLIRHESRPISRGELLKEVWGYNNPHLDTRTVDIHITKLRKKIRDNPTEPTTLLTIRGKGYKIQKL